MGLSRLVGVVGLPLICQTEEFSPVLDRRDVAKSLGMVQETNLDGGGSTTAVVGGTVLNSPSGGAERPVGDALLILPARNDDQDNTDK